MTRVTENGKVYELDDNGMVVSAANEAPVAEIEFEEEPLRIGERVEIDGRLGKIVTYTPSVYGDAIAVRFDTGELGEYLASDIERTSEAPLVFDTPIDEVKSDWTTYQELPEFTLAEVDKKAAVARRLNVTAKALVTDRRTALSDRVELDHIILATGTDLFDLRDKAERLNVTEHSDYLDALPKYQASDKWVTEQSRSREDVSWVLAMADTAAEELGSIDWEKHLASEALQATARLSSEQLSNPEFMERVAEYREAAMPKGFDDAKKKTFRAMLDQARKTASTERESQKVAKTARVNEELDDFDTSALFL